MEFNEVIEVIEEGNGFRKAMAGAMAGAALLGATAGPAVVNYAKMTPQQRQERYFEKLDKKNQKQYIKVETNQIARLYKEAKTGKPGSMAALKAELSIISQDDFDELKNSKHFANAVGGKVAVNEIDIIRRETKKR